MTGPKLQISEDTGRDKHRQFGESFEDAMRRIATALQDDDAHGAKLLEILLDQRFLPAGRVQSAAGSFRSVTAFNCFVSGVIPDSMVGIMDRLKEAALTMQKGGGIGYDFSTIRPRGDNIVSMASQASGVLSFMEPFDAVCGTVASAGNRRGAQMGVLRVDHPDIRAFIKAKNNNTYLTRFNISVGITDKFMNAVCEGSSFNLVFNGKVYETVDARELFNEIMQSTWDWAEPGVLFIDTMNLMNNLWYCETLAATNPCGEQPLPPYGACLLGSFNWVKYIRRFDDSHGGFYFDLLQMQRDIPVVVRAMDNVIDRTIYPLPEQEVEAKNKRRMGLGATGVANAMEALGLPYGSPEMLERLGGIMKMFNDQCYQASAMLAKEKGSFPLYDHALYGSGNFIQSLDWETQKLIRNNGIRNSHLTSIAPTGSISLAADNPSSGIEPPFLLEYNRKIKEFDGERIEKVTDYAYREWGIKGRTADELSPLEHVAVLNAVQEFVDSACSKTCNIGPEVTFEEFKKVYMKAWKGGAKGCTTFRSAGKRFGILTPVKEKRKQVAIEHVEEPDLIEGMACTFDPATGRKTCE